MIQVEGLAARPVVPSGRTDTNEVRAFFGVFDSVFQTMRQTTSRMTELAEDQARRKAEEEAERQAETLEQAKPRHLSDTAEDCSPGRLDRIREQAEVRDRKIGEVDRRNRSEARKDRQMETSDSHPEDPIDFAEQPGEAGLITTTSPPPLFMDSAPVFYFDMQKAGQAATSGESASTTAADVLPNVQQAEAFQTVPAGTGSENLTPVMGLNGVAGLSTEPATVSSRAGQDGVEGGLKGSQNTTTAAVKSGQVSSRSGGMGTQFQGVLEGVARTRSDANLSGAKSVQTQKQSSTPSGTIDLNRPGSIRELAHIVRGRAGSRHSSMTLRLDPPELGQVRIDVRMQRQELTLRIQADTAAGQEVLQGKLGDLRDALERQGIQVKEMEVEWRSSNPISEATHHPDDQSPQERPYDGSAFDRSGGQSDGSHHDTRFALAGGAGDMDHAALLVNEEYDGIVGLAETGVDLIV